MLSPKARRPWLRPLLAGILVLELVAASSILRSELFLREPLNQILGRLGDRMGGTWTFDGLSPHGLTAVEVRGLTFRGSTGLNELTIGQVIVHPDVGSLLSGQPGVSQLTVDQVYGELDLTQLEALVATWRGGRTAAANGLVDANSAGPVLPDQIELGEVVIRVRHPHLRQGYADIGASRVRLVRREGTLELAARLNLRGRMGRVEASRRSGDVQATLRFDRPVDLLGLIDVPPKLARAQLFARGVEVRGSDRLSLVDVTARRLPSPQLLGEDWSLDSVRAERLTVERMTDGLAIRLRDSHVDLVGEDGRTRVSMADIEWLPGAEGLQLTLGSAAAGRMRIRVPPPLPDGDVLIVADATDYSLDGWGGLIPAASPLQLDRGRFTGEVTGVLTVLDRQIQLTVDGTLEQATVLAPFLAARPLAETTLGVSGDIALDLVERQITWRDGRLLLEGVPLSFESVLCWSDDRPHFALQAELEEVGAEQLRRGLPTGLAPVLDGVSLGGTLSATFDVQLDPHTPEEATFEIALDTTAMSVVRFPADVPLDQLAGAFELELEAADGRLRTIGPARADWVTYDDVTRYLVPALVSAEDGRFWAHDGFDWRAVEASLEQNLRERRIVRGGSTITQQVVRSLFLGHERTLGRKFEEAFLTWQLEELASKERIMELYVNAVHWGPGLYGVREAAEAYFRRAPESLTVSEAAFLASILPNPDYFGTQYARGIIAPSRRVKVCNILRNMRNAGTITDSFNRRLCRDAQDGIVSVVPHPAWLVDEPDRVQRLVPALTAELTAAQ